MESSLEMDRASVSLEIGRRHFLFVHFLLQTIRSFVEIGNFFNVMMTHEPSDNNDNKVQQTWEGPRVDFISGEFKLKTERTFYVFGAFVGSFVKRFFYFSNESVRQ